MHVHQLKNGVVGIVLIGLKLIVIQAELLRGCRSLNYSEEEQIS